MPEKKNQETHQHAWPPEAVMCYMPTYFVLKEQEAGRDTYTLVRVASGKPGFVIRTNKYADLLETVIQDATIPVFSVTPQQLIEGSFGEPRWKYGSGDGEYKYDFAKHPDYFLKPDFEERKEYEPKAEEPKVEESCPEAQIARTSTPGIVFDDYCQMHKRKKQKDGHAPTGRGRPPRRKYQCPDCKAGKPPVTAAPSTGAPQPDPNRAAPTHTHDAKGKLPACYLDYCVKHKRPKTTNTMNSRGRTYRCSVCIRENKGRPRGGSRAKGGDGFSAGRKAALAIKLKNNPKCATCGERLRKGKKHKRKDGQTSQYWKRCVNGCTHTGQESEQQFNHLSVEELQPIVYKVLARHNGHDPQDRADIAQSIALDLHRGILKPADLQDRDRIRRYIDEQKRFSADGRRTLDLDAPVGDDSKMTYADTKPALAAECDPLQQLEAKEAVEARLRAQAASPPDEFTAPIVGDPRDSDGSDE
jgi:hypothetical protein